MLDTSAGKAEVGEFVGKICAYFRDFLETDFRKQRQSKRSVTLRDGAGNLTGISISKFPELVGDLWAALREPTEEGKPFIFKAGRTKYHSRINSNVADVVSRHVAALRQEDFNVLAENKKPENVNARTGLPKIRFKSAYNKKASAIEAMTQVHGTAGPHRVGLLLLGGLALRRRRST